MKKAITKDMFIQDIIHTYPETVQVFRDHKLDCMNCQIAEFEEICHGATVHHLDPNELIKKLNLAISKNEEDS